MPAILDKPEILNTLYIFDMPAILNTPRPYRYPCILLYSFIPLISKTLLKKTWIIEIIDILHVVSIPCILGISQTFDILNILWIVDIHVSLVFLIISDIPDILHMHDMLFILYVPGNFDFFKILYIRAFLYIVE